MSNSRGRFCPLESTVSSCRSMLDTVAWIGDSTLAFPHPPVILSELLHFQHSGALSRASLYFPIPDELGRTVLCCLALPRAKGDTRHLSSAALLSGQLPRSEALCRHRCNSGLSTPGCCGRPRLGKSSLPLTYSRRREKCSAYTGGTAHPGIA